MFSIVHSQTSPGSFLFAWEFLSAPKGRRVHSGSSGITQARLEVAVFILVRVGELRSCRAPRGCRFHSSLRGFNRAHAVGVGFIEVRVSLLGRALWFVGFIWIREGSLSRA